MALGLLYFAEARSTDGAQMRAELYEEGFAGSSTEITLGAVYERFGASGDDVFEPPVRASEVAVVFQPYLASTGALDGAVRDKLAATLTAAPRDYQLIYTRDGAGEYKGWLMPRFTRTALHDAGQDFTLVFKDRLPSLREIPYLDGADFFDGKASIAAIIADCAAQTGLSFKLASQALWQPDAETLRPLEVQADRARFSEVLRDGTGREAFDRLTVLEALLRAYGCQMIQADNLWRITYAPAHAGATHTRHVYTAAGVFENTFSGITTGLAIDSRLWYERTDEGAANEPARLSRAAYVYGPIDAGSVSNGNFEQWEHTDPTAPKSWIRSGGVFGTDYLKRQVHGEMSRYYAGSIRETTVANGTSVDGKKDACNRFYYQAVGNFAPSTVVTVRFLFAAWKDALQWPHKVKASEAYYMVHYLEGGNDYWYTKQTGTWQLQAAISTADRRNRMNGEVGEFNTISYFSNEVIEEVQELPATPGTGTGTMTLWLGNSVRELPVGGDILPSQEVWVLYDDVELRRGTDGPGDGITYIVTDATVTEGIDDEVSLLVGDGPIDEAPGALWLSDGTTRADNWRDAPAAALMPHTQLVATERVRAMRKARRRVRLQLDGVNNALVPYRSFRFDGVPYWPVYLETARTTQGTSQIVEGVEILSETQTGLTTEQKDRAVGLGGGAGGRAAIFAGLSDRILNGLLKDAATTLSASILAGSRTSCTINPVSGDVFKDNEDIAILDVVTGEVYFLTVDGDYSAGSSTLTFDAFVFDHDVKVGSYVFADTGAALVRLAITENVIALSVEAGELCKVNETIASPTARNTIATDGLNYDVDDNDEHWLVRKDGSASYKLFSRADQVATAANFLFDNGSGGNVTITAAIGDYIVPAAAFLGAKVTIKAGEVRAEVASVIDAETLGRLNGAVATTVTSISIKPPGLTDPVLDDQKLAIGTLSQSDWQTITVNGDHAAGAGTLNIDSIALTQSDDAEIRVPGNRLSSQLRLRKDEIDLRVTKTTFDEKLLGPLVALINGTSTGGASITVKWPGEGAGTGTTQDLVVGMILAIRHKTDKTMRYVRVRTAATGGATSINIGNPADTTSTSFTFTSVPDGSPVFIYQGDPVHVQTGINLSLSGIEVEAKILHSHDWDGVYNATTGVITTPGTKGWALTGVDGQQADADVTGTLHFGGGVGEAGATGIDLDMTSVFEQARAVTFVDGGGNKVHLQARTNVGVRIFEVAAQTGDEISFVLGTARTLSVFNTHALVTGGLIVDTDTLYVDATNNRVGIGTASPGFPLEVTGSAKVTSNLWVQGYIVIDEQAAPATPAAGTVRLYAKTDGRLYWKDDAGTEHEIATVP